jgi:hypothetical protein
MYIDIDTYIDIVEIELELLGGGSGRRATQKDIDAFLG